MVSHPWFELGKFHRKSADPNIQNYVSATQRGLFELFEYIYNRLCGNHKKLEKNTRVLSTMNTLFYSEYRVADETRRASQNN